MLCCHSPIKNRLLLSVVTSHILMMLDGQDLGYYSYAYYKIQQPCRLFMPIRKSLFMPQIENNQCKRLYNFHPILHLKHRSPPLESGSKRFKSKFARENQLFLNISHHTQRTPIRSLLRDVVSPMHRHPMFLSK